jgi:hypothetical protein
MVVFQIDDFWEKQVVVFRTFACDGKITFREKPTIFRQVGLIGSDFIFRDSPVLSQNGNSIFSHDFII